MFEVSSPKIAIRVLLGQPKINVIVFASIFILMKLYVMFYSTYIDFGAWNSEISIGRCSIFYKLEDFPRTITQPSDLEKKSISYAHCTLISQFSAIHIFLGFK